MIELNKNNNYNYNLTNLNNITRSVTEMKCASDNVIDYLCNHYIHSFGYSFEDVCYYSLYLYNNIPKMLNEKLRDSMSYYHNSGVINLYDENESFERKGALIEGSPVHKMIGISKFNSVFKLMLLEQLQKTINSDDPRFIQSVLKKKTNC